MFFCGSKLFFQTTGVPIGGPLSAQLASLYCMACEHHQLKICLNTTVFGKLVRFRDNIILLLGSDFSTSEVGLYLQSMYQLEFTVEQAGPTIQSLEFQITKQTTPAGFLSKMKVEWKGAVQPINILHRPEMACKRWVSPWSSNAKFICTTYLPAILRKINLYTLPTVNKRQAIEYIQESLSLESYPKRWTRVLWQAVQRCKREGIG